MNEAIKINTDGGARGNPGPAAAAFVVTNHDGEIVASDSKYLGVATNNTAEYQGVILALQWLTDNAKLITVSPVTFYLDSELVTKQLNGQYAVKHPDLKVLFKRAIEMIKALPFSITFRHVRREENKAADLLVNEALDGQTV